MRTYEDTEERTACLSQRSRHCTAKPSCRAALQDQKCKAIQLWHGLAVVLGYLMELSSELPIASGAVVKWQASPESGRVLLMIAGPLKRRTLPGKLLFLVSYMTVHKRPPIYIDCTSWRFSEKTSQVSYIDDRLFYLLTVYAA